ncbi:hypothetical protein DFH09DRAFT_1211224 [Mycena vulgaris]|nr:hypothetical protein DFH09DRAFT_1211224 [Mycena vulgaris]
MARPKPKNKSKVLLQNNRRSTAGRPRVKQWSNAASVELSHMDDSDEAPSPPVEQLEEPQACVGKKRKRIATPKPTEPPKYPAAVRAGRGEAAGKERYIPHNLVPEVNVQSLLDALDRPGSVTDMGCYNCISFDRLCKPDTIMSKCKTCAKQGDSHCGHALTFYEHHKRINHAQPHSELSNATLNSAIEQHLRDSDALAGMQTMFNEQRLRTMASAHRLSSLVLAHYQFYGPVAVPELHKVPEHLHEVYSNFLLTKASEKDLPYLDTENVLRAEGVQFTPLPLETDRTLEWAKKLLGYNVSPPPRKTTPAPNNSGEGGSRFAGAIDDSSTTVMNSQEHLRKTPVARAVQAYFGRGLSTGS